jgi:hypothetical protein
MLHAASNCDRKRIEKCRCTSAIHFVYSIAGRQIEVSDVKMSCALAETTLKRQ